MSADFYAKVSALGESLVDHGNRLSMLVRQRQSVLEVVEKTRAQFSSGDVSKKVLDQTTARLERELKSIDREIQKVLERVIKKVLDATK
jgi:hypothetical protein